MPDELPQGPRMDSAVVCTLFHALACAAQKPASFEIESRNDQGMQGITVLVIDANAYNRIVAPALAAMSIDVEDLNP